MKRYVCKEGFSIEMVDDDGFFTGEYQEVEKGSLWERSEDPYRMVGAADTVRLNRLGSDDTISWLEITTENLAMHFEEVDSGEDHYHCG